MPADFFQGLAGARGNFKEFWEAVMRQRQGIHFIKRVGFISAVLLISVAVCCGQDHSGTPGVEPASTDPGVLRDLVMQVKELRAAMAQMQGQMDQIQVETTKLKTELHETRSRLVVSAPNSLASLTSSPYSSNKSSSPSQDSTENKGSTQNQEEDRLSKIEEDNELLRVKLKDQYQTKVESASKYRVRLSGIALFNAFTNRGAVDNQEVPTWATSRNPGDSNGSFGATVRQSEIGLEAFGPKLAGAQTRGEVQMDFSGGVPYTSNGITAGTLRMRIATVRMDWKDTSIVAGQDALFFSPLSPTSFASLAEPALSYAGNLWTWTPQIRVEHQIHVSDTSGVILQAGILDPLTGEFPSSELNRSPQAGEFAGQPAYATRLAWTQSAFGRPLTVGVGSYFSRQNWGFGRNIIGWAGTADLDLPLGRWFTFSGEFYRGRAIGGLSGGLGRSVLYNGSLTSPSTSVLGLNTVGGWGQLGFRPTERLEFNGAMGQDNPLASNFRDFYATQSYLNAPITRNRGAFANVIYHPRSNLILSMEFRRYWTFHIDDANQKANQVNLGVGILF